MADRPTRTLSIVAACAALPYISSKVVHALQGRLGVHGGPDVPSAAYADFDGSAAVSAAQWGNAAIGAGILVISLVPATGLVRRLRRWMVVAPLFAAVASLAGGGLVMASGALDGRGGGPFSVYLLVWAVMVLALAVRLLVARTQRPAPSIAGARP